MRKARGEVIDPGDVNIVHVYARTVRRCFLFGFDKQSGKNYDHRKEWIEEILQHFARFFAIDLLSFAILSNHYHLIFRTRPDVVLTWDDDEVARRWLMICPHRRDQQGDPKPPTEKEIRAITRCPLRLAQIRSRLADLSWWMRLMNQRIATRCNDEDDASGRFFEQRFGATRLVDEASLLVCSAYVDLNPVRAAMAETIQGSDHTSAQRRIEGMKADLDSQTAGQRQVQSDPPEPSHGTTPAVVPLRRRGDEMLAPLRIDEANDPTGPCPSESPHRCSDKGFLAMPLADYLDLLEWTARQLRSDKSGTMPASAPRLFERLGLTEEKWLELVGNFGRLFSHVAGRPRSVDSMRSHKTHRRFKLRRRARQLLG